MLLCVCQLKKSKKYQILSKTHKWKYDWHVKRFGLKIFDANATMTTLFLLKNLLQSKLTLQFESQCNLEARQVRHVRINGKVHKTMKWYVAKRVRQIHPLDFTVHLRSKKASFGKLGSVARCEISCCFQKYQNYLHHRNINGTKCKNVNMSKSVGHLFQNLRIWTCFLSL